MDADTQIGTQENTSNTDAETQSVEQVSEQQSTASNEQTNEQVDQQTDKQENKSEGQWFSGFDATVQEQIKDCKTVGDALAKFKDILGKTPKAPEKASDYDLNGLSLSEQQQSEVGEAFKKAGLSTEQAATVMQVNAKLLSSARETLMQDGEQSLRGEWKNDFQKNLDIANVAVAKFCSPEMKKLMNDTGLGNSAVFAKMFYSIGKAMSEDSLVNGENGSGGSSLSLADRLYPKQGK